MSKQTEKRFKNNACFYLIGYPLSHSFSPRIYNAFFAERKINATYKLFEIEENAFEKKIKAFLSQDCLAGFNITQPYKNKIIPFLDALSKDAETLQSVNCVAKRNGSFIGFNTDKAGFLKTLEPFKEEISGKNALLLGAGGVAPSIVSALIDAGISKIVIYNRTKSRAENLRKKFLDKSTSVSIEVVDKDALNDSARKSAIVVNATTVGLNGEKSIVSERAISAGQILYDLIYNPPETDFLRIGKMKNAVTINGMAMLKAQAEENLKIWGLK